jgi:hypothetical protein
MTAHLNGREVSAAAEGIKLGARPKYSFASHGLGWRITIDSLEA